ncbi:MAG: tRNA uridine-5-carboxymethylaminomethyl(34) synthesis GTPase MnmE [Bacteroidales bacterium]|nr:tRNA uridine-5-carboxymethylaminomethyl(34) synthesis GTPase MnmE [Bacteroidales bacterium]
MMISYCNNDTICAISTPPGCGAIAVIRLSGSEARDIALKSFIPKANKTLSHSTCVYGSFLDNNGEMVDETVTAYFQAPHSYTGEDLVEISCHGSVYIQKTILEILVSNGARLALPGEFTFRAYRNGKLDLAQSEAVADLISSENKQAHDVAVRHLKGTYSSFIKELRDKLLHLLSLLELELDFSEEDVAFADRTELINLLETIEKEVTALAKSFELGNALKTGIPVAIIGKPNVGKSTLLNALLKEDRAIVSDIPGTTRDVIEDVININGYPFRFIDTAGLHATQDVIESIGIEKTIERINKADIVLHVVDLTQTDIKSLQSEIDEFTGHITDDTKKWIIVGNKEDKIDSVPEWGSITANGLPIDTVIISAKQKLNINQINETLYQYVESKGVTGVPTVTGVRHYEALIRALESIASAKKAFADNVPADLLAIDIRQTAFNLGSIVGDISTEDVLSSIFSKFCIGK